MKFCTNSTPQKSILNATGFQIKVSALTCFEHLNYISQDRHFLLQFNLFHFSFIFHTTGKEHTKNMVNHNI